jgi:hypothetical protein
MPWSKKRPRTTGVRDVSEMVNGLASGAVTLIRVGDTVTLGLETAVLTGGGYQRILTLPYGFRPPSLLRENLVSPSNGWQIALNPSGVVYSNRADDWTFRYVLTYVTEDQWPVALPGRGD